MSGKRLAEYKGTGRQPFCDSVVRTSGTFLLYRLSLQARVTSQQSFILHPISNRETKEFCLKLQARKRHIYCSTTVRISCPDVQRGGKDTNVFLLVDSTAQMSTSNNLFLETTLHYWNVFFSFSFSFSFCFTNSKHRKLRLNRNISIFLVFSCADEYIILIATIRVA